MKVVTSVGLSVLALLLGGCASEAGLKATAMIAPTSAAAAAGMNPSGTMSFSQRGGKVRVSGRITGLQPNREHGFHVHEAGDCSDDGMGTKGHFNPDGAAHGRHSVGTHHAGDMPALRADANGAVDFAFDMDRVTLGPGPNSLIGRGVIVHRDPDDYVTQPTGNSGPRPGCGVIRAG